MPKHLQCTLAALTTCILGSLVVGLITVTEWLSPNTPALILLGAVLVPAMLVGLLVASPSEDEPWTRKLLITGIVPGAILGILTVALGFFWTQPHVRAKIASSLSISFQDATPVFNALNDPHDDVAFAACRVLADSNFRYYYRETIAALVTRPEAALKCLQFEPAKHDRVIYELTTEWHQVLMRDPVDQSTACTLSNSLANVTSYKNIHAAELLQCAFSATEPNAQQCCIQALNQSYQTPKELSELLQTSTAILADFTLGPDLINASFYDKPTLGSTSLKTKDFQRIALLTNCDALADHATTSINAFYKLANSLNCATENQEIPTQPTAWQRVCTDLTRQFSANPDQTPNLAFCSALENEKRYLIKQQEELQAVLNQETEDLSGLSEDIVAGHELEHNLDPTGEIAEALDNKIDLQHLSADELQNYAALFEAIGHLEDDKEDENPGEIPKEALDMLENFPATIKAFKDAGASKEQVKAFEQINEVLQNANGFKGPPKRK